MERKLIIITVIYIVFYQKVLAQSSYAEYSNTPKELLRKRVKDNEPGFRYGNPHPILCFFK